MEYIKNVPLSEQIDILLFDIKQQPGWSLNSVIPKQFHKIHEINLANIYNAGISDVPKYTYFQPGEADKNKTIIDNSIKLMKNGQLTWILYYYTYFLLLNNYYYSLSDNTGYSFTDDINIDDDMSGFDVATYNKYTNKLFPGYIPEFGKNINSLTLLPFVGDPSPVANFNDLNYSFKNQIYPVGYSLLQDNYYDGLFSGSLRFFDHDIEHANEFNEIIKEHPSYLPFLKDIYDSCHDRGQWAQYLIFLITHEAQLTFSRPVVDIRKVVELIYESECDPEIIKEISNNQEIDIREYGDLNSYIDMIDQLRDLGVDIDYATYENGQRVDNCSKVIDLVTEKILQLNSQCGLADKILAYTSIAH